MHQDAWGVCVDQDKRRRFLWGLLHDHVEDTVRWNALVEAFKSRPNPKPPGTRMSGACRLAGFDTSILRTDIAKPAGSEYNFGSGRP
jgi:hypothetical protein